MNQRIARYLVVLALVAGGCNRKADREADLAALNKREHEEAAAAIKKKVAEAQPRLAAFREILRVVDSLPPPQGLAGVKLEKEVPFLQLDYARLVASPGPETQLDGVRWYGANAEPYREGWFGAVRLAANRSPSYDEAEDSGVVEREFAAWAALRQVIVVRPLAFSKPMFDGASYKAGQLTAFAYVFDLPTKRVLGGVAFTARSAESVNFDYREKGGESARSEAAESALRADLGTKIETALRAALAQATR